MKVKGQTAMEYLMTYGWAILIVIVVVAALYSMGVFSTKGGVPCSPCFSKFAYVDHNATYLMITSGAEAISISSITNTGGGVIGGFTAGTLVNPGTVLTLTGTFGNGNIINIGYTRQTGMSGTDSATLHTV
jgi:hypothetical protein